MCRSSVIIDRAIQRDGLPDAADPRAILERAASPIYLRILVTDEPVNDDGLQLFARRAIHAAQCGEERWWSGSCSVHSPLRRH